MPEGNINYMYKLLNQLSEKMFTINVIVAKIHW